MRLDGRAVARVTSDDSRQLTTVKLHHAAAAGAHTLTFAYTGKLETQPQGLFLQSFTKPGGEKGRMLSSQFEPTDARRMFPSWDEPAFRATYTISLTAPAAWSAVSNMPVAKRVQHGALATTTFAATPRMSTYLVHVSAGDLAAITDDSGPTKLGVWAIRGRENEGATALANAKQILADFNDYFGYAFPLPKLDSIAVPGGFGGAMENWGAIAYKDVLLLLSASSTVGERQEVFSIQAHEMAHQWNGDLVTMGWWDDIWLNESFASFVGAKEVNLRNPSWNWMEGEDASKESAMSADSSLNSHAIEQHVADELQANNAFDPQITYDKGEAVLRMLESHLGADTFRDGVRRLMKARAFSNASSGDLWAALSAASGHDVEAIAESWTAKPGFPVVSVTAHCAADGARSITLSQQRFLLRGTDPANSHWDVPLQIRSGTEAAPRAQLLSRDGQEFPAGHCGETLSVNSGAVGYFRARYDDATLRTTTAQLATLRDSERIALLDDQWALVESGAAPLESYLAIVASMGSNLNGRAWEQITGALGTVEYDLRGTAGHAGFSEFARGVLKPIADQLGWEPNPSETPNLQRLRRVVLRDLGTWGDPAVVAEAQRRFEVFVRDPTSIRPDEQGLVLSVVAQNADAETFERLHALAKASDSDSALQRRYSALTAVRAPALAEKVASIVLSDEIPPQAETMRLGLVMRLATDHPQLAWRTFLAHKPALMAPQTMFADLIVAQYIPEAMWDALPLDELEAWLKANVPAEMGPNVARGMERARFLRSEKELLGQTAAKIVGASH